VAWRMAAWARMLLAHGAGTAILFGPLPLRADPTLHERSPLSLVIFGSLESGAEKLHGALGLKKALGGAGLDASGFRFGAKWGESLEPAQRRPDHGRLFKTEFHVTIGYEWRIGDTFLALAAGPELEAAYVETRDRRSLSQRIGPRLQFDLWAKPHGDWLVQANAYAVSSDGGRFWTRLAAGWRLTDELYLGPEAEGYREGDYRKLRFGLHLTGLRLFGLTWRLAAGLQKTSDRKRDSYVTLGLLWQR